MTRSATEVRVGAGRMVRWVDNFATRHGKTRLAVDAGELTGRAADGSMFIASLPFASPYVGEPIAAAFAAAAAPPPDWGVLLVRKGGFAVARLHGSGLVDHKIGQRHVQGRSKAGGWSQQRFARRRANQAREAYEAAAEHAARILDAERGPVVTGGDHRAVDEVLADPRLQGLQVAGPWIACPDPKRDTLDRAVAEACAVRIEVLNADG